MSLDLVPAIEQNTSHSDLYWPFPSQQFRCLDWSRPKSATGWLSTPLLSTPLPDLVIPRHLWPNWIAGPGFWTHWAKHLQQYVASGPIAPEHCAVLSVWIGEFPTESVSSSATIACTDFALVQAREAAIQEVEAIYSLRNASMVRHFVRCHPEVIETLIEARPRLEEHFGPQVKVSLELVSDPEADATEQLFAYIVTSLPVDEGINRLDAFDEDWFLHQIDRVAGRLNFNLEFV